jgi:hypothetical protein
MVGLAASLLLAPKSGAILPTIWLVVFGEEDATKPNGAVLEACAEYGVCSGGLEDTATPEESWPKFAIPLEFGLEMGSAFTGKRLVAAGCEDDPRAAVELVAYIGST